MNTTIKKTIRNAAGVIWNTIPPQLRYGRKYIAYRDLLSHSQWWSIEEHKNYQFYKLKELVSFAEKHIPFYTKLFKDSGFSSDQLKSFSDYHRIPMIDKSIILQNKELMISDIYSKRDLEVRTTGGTTGQQLSFFAEKRSYNARELPFVDSIWNRVGYIRGKSKVARLRNDILPAGKLWEYNYVTKELVLDSYHMTDDVIEQLLKKISDWGAEYLHTYPSSALLLCEHIKKTNTIYKSNLKAILVTSENLYPGQLEVIEKSLGARCFTFYGHTECAAIAGWCEFSNLYHIQSEYGYLELVNEEGKVIEEPGIRGEIVCTGFDNFAMPFIRYRTGDYSSYASNQKCQCGRNYKLLDSIEGRWTQEMFVGKDLNKISMTSINMHSEIFNNVENYQFEQNEPGLCILRIVKKPGYVLDDEEKILKELGKKFSNSIVIHISYVNEIERTERGKQRFIIQNLELGK